MPRGDIEIHSELNETAQPGYRGTKTTLTDREPSVTAERHAAAGGTQTRKAGERVYAEIRYEDDSGPQLYLMTQNEVRVGRGGGDEPMDLALYTNDEVSREHFLRRDPAIGVFSIVDESTNGTWLNGTRLKMGAEEVVPDRSQIGVAEVLTLAFDVRKSAGTPGAGEQHHCRERAGRVWRDSGRVRGGDPGEECDGWGRGERAAVSGPTREARGEPAR